MIDENRLLAYLVRLTNWVIDSPSARKYYNEMLLDCFDNQEAANRGHFCPSDKPGLKLRSGDKPHKTTGRKSLRYCDRCHIETRGPRTTILYAGKYKKICPKCYDEILERRKVSP